MKLKVLIGGGQSIFDKICKDDLIMAFFPCVRFEVQSLLLFRTDNFGMINWSIQKKLEYDLKLHNELHQLYEMITKLALICVNRQLPLIIENPYNTQHYLKNYWCLKPSIIDYNRNMSGDYYKKPTQYWFINCEPKQNIVFEAYTRPKTKAIEDESTVERSMISKEYANRFIREYIIGDLKIERKEQKNIFDLLENENDHIE